MSATVTSIAAARERRIATIRWEVAECRKAVSEAKWRFGARSWQHQVCAAELFDAESRLSVAEGMPRRAE